MVFFTCNHCGESVKKPSVDKHYNTKCRGAPKSISCMDCQKDFKDNYVEHVKCISELEKYSGKDYVPRENANSGAKKQEGWVETVRAVLDSSEYELSKQTRQAFEMIQKFDNVPRKKAKFLNFVTNSVRIPRKTVEEVWNILEKEQEKLKEAKQKQLEAAKIEKKDKDPKEKSNDEPKTKKQKLEEGDQAGEEKLNKKKKSKKTEDSSESEAIAEKTSNHVTPNDNESKLEKKKKKKELQQNGDDEEDAVAKQQETEQVAYNADVVKKKKKKLSQTDETPEDQNLNNVDEHLNKKKKKNAEKNGIDKNEEQTRETEDAGAQKKKKKRAASNEDVEVDTPIKKQKKNEEKQEDTTLSKKKEKKNSEAEESEAYVFSWDFEFTNLMGKYADGIDLEKLKKKIFKKYKTKFDDELTERQQLGFEKKFKKKLKNISSLKIEDNIVKCVS